MLFPKIYRSKDGKWNGQWLDTKRSGSRLVWAVGNAPLRVVIYRMTRWLICG